MDKLSFYVNKKIVYVDVVKTQNKNMYLKIINNKITVLVPPFTLPSTVKKFVDANIKKFVQHLENQKSVETYSLDKSFFMLFGHKYNFKVLTGFTKPQVKVNHDIYYFYLKDNDQQTIKTFLLDFLKEKLKNELINLHKEYEKKMDIPEYLVKVSNKKTNWGTNFANKRQIIYAFNLVFYQKEVIEYLVIHELSHCFEMNHSQNFWAIVKKWMPNYKEVQSKLKNHLID